MVTHPSFYGYPGYLQECRLRRSNQNEAGRVLTTFSHYKPMGIFSEAQGQLTPQSLSEPGRNLSVSEILWLSSLPASMKKIQSKVNALECSQHFPHYNLMGAIRYHGNQSSNSNLAQHLMRPFPHPNNASDKIWLRSANWSQRYSCLKVWTRILTHRCRLDWYTIS